MSYNRLTISIDKRGDEPRLSLTITASSTGITLEDPGLWPSENQIAGGDWVTRARHGDGVLIYFGEQETLTYVVGGSHSTGGLVTASYRGEPATYLAAVMAQLHSSPGYSHKIPAAPEGITVDVIRA